MLFEEPQDTWSSVDERRGEERKRGGPHDDQQLHTVSADGSKFVGLVADPAVMGDRDPATLADGLKPGFVGAVVLEVVLMALDSEASLSQDLREAGAEVTVGEEDNAQATRSYSTACSISVGLRP